MEREQNTTDPDGLAEVWRTAERRRAEDLGVWLSQWVEQKRRLKSPMPTDPPPNPNPGATAAA
jgi:hypothetical protein